MKINYSWYFTLSTMQLIVVVGSLPRFDWFYGWEVAVMVILLQIFNWALVHSCRGGK